jgi:prepilin-type N-terminal cleavage/methylation domain-containing protein
MKDLNMNVSQTNNQKVSGFTLIELLVVIAIIGILAALLLPAGVAIQRNSTKKRVRAELQKVEMAIEAYKAKLGHYPPDNPNNIAVNPLYFELLGVKDAGTQFQTLSGNGVINKLDVPTFYGTAPNPPVTGFVNSGAASDESTSAAKTFLTDIVPAQYRILKNNGVDGAVLGTVVEGPLMLTGTDGTKINPFRYNSSNPTNKLNSFDLSVDIIIGGKTNRICNWSDTPIINP